MKEIYYSESIQQKAVSSAGWADEEGIRRKGNQCFRGHTDVTFVLVDAKNLETVKEMKNKVRALFNVGNHSVHINDTHEETS